MISHFWLYCSKSTNTYSKTLRDTQFEPLRRLLGDFLYSQLGQRPTNQYLVLASGQVDLKATWFWVLSTPGFRTFLALKTSEEKVDFSPPDATSHVTQDRFRPGEHEYSKYLLIM